MAMTNDEVITRINDDSIPLETLVAETIERLDAEGIDFARLMVKQCSSSRVHKLNHLLAKEPAFTAAMRKLPQSKPALPSDKFGLAGLPSGVVARTLLTSVRGRVETIQRELTFPHTPERMTYIDGHLETMKQYINDIENALKDVP